MTAAGGTAPDSEAAPKDSARLPSLAKYDVLEELGHGGMATVYRAHDPRLARDVAVKVLHPHLRESREIAHRFGVEAKAVAKLKHPNIVEVFDVSSEDDREQFLVVELVRGATLRRLLATHGAMPPEVVAAIGLELIGALHHAHEAGVVHRDVKPENVLVEHRPEKARGGGDADAVPAESLTPAPTSRPSGPPSGRRSQKDAGSRVRIKLTDFGIAKLLDAQGVTSTGQVLGSPAHMAPEQIEGGDVDARADVFGLGVLLYEGMVGHLPFTGNNPAQVLRRVLDGIYATAERERPTVGKVWSSILDRALARDADARYPSVDALGEAISAELERLGVDAPRAEIEAFFDDPDGYHVDHEARMVAALSRLGAEARRDGRPLEAAADYNRALAYAPSDPAILRVVSTMHRAEARARAVKRAAPMLAAVLALGATSYGVARAFRAPPAGPGPSPSSVASEVASSAAPSASLAAAPPSASVSSTPAPFGVVSVAVTAQPPPKPTSERPPKDVRRALALATVRPVAGVRVSVDGAGPVEALDGTTLTLDEKSHELTFTCANDMCEPQRRAVPAGDRELAPLAVEMRIRDATLVVTGSATSFYGVEQLPQLTLRSGTPVRVPMTRGSYTVVVFDRTNPEQKQGVTLIAGRRAEVRFGAP